MTAPAPLSPTIGQCVIGNVLFTLVHDFGLYQQPGISELIESLIDAKN